MNPPAFHNGGGFWFLVWNESGFKTGLVVGLDVDYVSLWLSDTAIHTEEMLVAIGEPVKRWRRKD